MNTLVNTISEVAPLSHVSTSNGAALVDQVDLLRVRVSCDLEAERRAELGQFFTPAPVASLIASMFDATQSSLRILDPGAGIGSLSIALVAELCRREQPPTEISLTAYEVDRALNPHLKETVEFCRALCDQVGIRFDAEILHEDFIEVGVGMLGGGFFAPSLRRFNAVVMNPPYRKIHSQSRERLLLKKIGIETSNLYTGFLALALRMLEPGGELVAITPRSFFNGPYFKPFRAELLDSTALRRIHVFKSRRTAFQDDAVLQENVILHAVKDPSQQATITISSSDGAGDDEVTSVREVEFERLVRPGDEERFIHLVPDEISHAVSDRMHALPTTIADLGITVSTGRVVDFRAKDYLRAEPGEDTVPLVYPTHFADGFVSWPKQTRKPNAIVSSAATADLLVPSGTYVLVKRFSSKEERRRVAAAIWDPTRTNQSAIGFENHLNYFHTAGRGLQELLAKGLLVYLNSSLVDEYFRQFSGHTQVNATDLRNLRYPNQGSLERLGAQLNGTLPPQEEIDRMVDREIRSDGQSAGDDPILAKHKQDQALSILKAVGLPRAQQNDRSALTLLALLGLRPAMEWSDAGNPLMGITPMMEFMATSYGRTYAPNSRESVRRFTVHQFLQAGIILRNPDKPDRPTNSGDTVYQVESHFLDLVRTFGTPGWNENLTSYLATIVTLQERYARERLMERIPVTLVDGTDLALSPGGQNVLVKEIIEQFCSRFTPGAHVIYVGDTADKFAYFDREALAALGVSVEEHGKLPDVVVFYMEKGWLVLIEAVTSHGPIDAKRHIELQELFARSTAPLVFVTAFLNRQAMVSYLDGISWETEVWMADTPSHMIHFNGERFLGPYAIST